MAAYEQQLASSTAASASAHRIAYHVSVHAVDEVRARAGVRARG